MNGPNLELYPLRIFCQVLQDQTFSAAAKSLRVSQPTVSQQIAKLESELGVRLFQRVGHEIVPTEQARELQRFALPLLEDVRVFSERMNQGLASPRGLVRYAMPESCQWTPHYRKIMSQISAFPEIQFRIGIQPTDTIIQDLLEGRLDFGFIVGERAHPELRFEKFADEAYSAVASKTVFFDALKDPKRIAGLRLITYPGWELFFTSWAKKHGVYSAWKARPPEPSVQIGTLAGAIHAAQEGAGVAIIPTHCIAGELDRRDLLEWKTKGVVASHPVYLVRRTGEKLPRRAELVIELLKTAKAGSAPR